MTTDKKPTDWERIELDYRAGILTLREMATAGGVTEGAIRKRAKRDDWARDLSAKIKAKADDLVRKEEVRKEVRSESTFSEKVLVDAGAQRIAEVRMAHRSDISRARSLTNKLLDELESVTDEQGTIKDLIKAFKEEDHEDGDAMADMLALANKIGALPSRTKTMKELAETMKTLITLERDAYDIVTASKVDLNVDGVALPTIINLVGPSGSD